MAKDKKRDHCGLTIMLEMHGELPSDPVDRMTEVIRAILTINTRILNSTDIARCAAYQALVAVMVEEMADNDHLGCAADLVNQLAVDIAVRMRQEGARVDS